MKSATVDSRSYWLLEWLKSNRVKTIARAAALLANPSGVRKLREFAEQWSKSVVTQAPPGVNLVAGTGLRLNDLLTCPNPTCRRQQVDVLFRHAWHYFDRVLLPDGVGELLLHPSPEWDQEYLLEMLLHRIDSVLHIQQLGANDLVCYYPSISEATGNSLGQEQKERWREAYRDVMASLASELRYHFEGRGPGLFAVEYEDPQLRQGGRFELKLNKDETPTEERLRTKAAHELAHFHISYLQQDLGARRMLGGSLGSVVWTHERALSRISGHPESSEILFHLLLPSLAHIPVRDLIAVRAAEGASFEAFQNALTKATREMVDNRGVSNPGEAAAKIVREIVEPELARLEQKLRAAQRVLARKTAVSVALAGLTTTCGLLLGGGALAVVGGIGALITGTGTAASKYLEEKQSIELADMYFLWKALGHAE